MTIKSKETAAPVAKEGGGRVLTEAEAKKAMAIISANMPKHKVEFFNNKRSTMRMLKWGVGEALTIKISKQLKKAGLPHAVASLYETSYPGMSGRAKKAPNAIVIRVPLDFDLKGSPKTSKADPSSKLEAQIEAAARHPAVQKYLQLVARRDKSK